MTEIRIDGVTKRFGQTVALEDVSLEVGDAEMFFLLGPSGCGKTTLLRIVAGLESADSGRIHFEGRDVTGMPARLREAVMVFQSYALWPHMTVEANVAFGLEVRGVGRSERARAAREALAKVRLEALATRRPGQISGGQQQRVALARALVVRPRVLLLDEPLSNLDAGLRGEMRAEIRALVKEAGLTAVYVTHDRHEAMAVADRIALMRAGRIEQVGTPREMYARPSSRFAAAFMGTANFIPCVVRGGGERPLVETPLGTFPATAPEAGSARLVCCVRPEALRRPPGPGIPIEGTVREAVFLGERAEFVVEIEGVDPVTVYEQPPGPGILPGERIALVLDPDRVVVLPDGEEE